MAKSFTNLSMVRHGIHFDIGNVHYVVTPIDHGDNPTNYTQKDVYNWLKNDLAMMKKRTGIDPLQP